MNRSTTKKTILPFVLAVLVSGCSTVGKQPELADNSDSASSAPVSSSEGNTAASTGNTAESQANEDNGSTVAVANDVNLPQSSGDTILSAEEVSDLLEEMETSATAMDNPAKDASSPEIEEIQPVEQLELETDDLWVRLRSGFQMGELQGAQDRLQRFEKWYARHPKYFQRLAERAYWYLPYILDQVEERGMPHEVAILPAIESAFRPEATSRSRAAGMWQFIGATGRRFGLRQDWWMDGRRDFVLSTRAALDYLEYLAQEFDNDWELVFAAYNAGEGAIRRHIRKNKSQNKPANYAELALRKETAEYVPKLLAVRNIIIAPEKYGIELIHLPNEPTLSVIDAGSQTDLTVAASFSGISSERLHKFNLGYKRGVTPPEGPHTIVIPTEFADSTLAQLTRLSHQDRMRWARHRVRKGEYIGRIARKHGVSIKSIMLANNLTSNLIQPGQELRIPISKGSFQFAKSSMSDVEVLQTDKVYQVQQGDSLWKLSRRFNVPLTNLLTWNQLTKTSVLKLGQNLIVGR